MNIWEFANANPIWFTLNVAIFSSVVYGGLATALTIIGASKTEEHHHYNGDIQLPQEEEK